VTLRFSDLNPLGRAIIIAVAVLTFGVAAVSFATSYGALYAYARDTGLYSERLTRLWPLLLDGAFIVAQLAAILAGILRGSRGWPILTMPLTGVLTVWFNLQHAGSDPGRRLAAALPPVLMMLALRSTCRSLAGPCKRSASPSAPIAPPPAEGMLPGAIWRPDALGWNAPPNGLPGAWPPGSYGHITAGHHLPENRQNGQAGLAVGNGADPAGMTKRQRIEEYLDWLGPEELQSVTVRELTAELASQGLEVTERYVKQILDQQRPPAQPQRKRGVAPADRADDCSEAGQASGQGSPASGAQARPGAAAQPGSRGSRPRRGPGRRAAAGRGRRPGRGSRLLPACASGDLASHAAAG
jgi:hypothetical protein